MSKKSANISTMIRLYSRTPEPATVDHNVLDSLFSRETGNNDTAFLHRRPRRSGRVLTRIVFPTFMVKVTDVSGHPRYSLKPDLFATFMFVVFVVTSISFRIDPSATDGNPTWLPLIFVGWYVIQAVMERAKTKAAFDRITNGVPLGAQDESDIVAQVTALLKQEQNESPPES